MDSSSEKKNRFVRFSGYGLYIERSTDVGNTSDSEWECYGKNKKNNRFRECETVAILWVFNRSS